MYVSDYSLLHTFKRHLGVVRSIKFNGQFLVSGGDRKMICIWCLKVCILCSYSYNIASSTSVFMDDTAALLLYHHGHYRCPSDSRGALQFPSTDWKMSCVSFTTVNC